MKTTEPAAPAPSSDGRDSAAKAGAALPRLLVIDFTRVGEQYATGQLKRNFLIGWPDDAFLQIAVRGGRFLVVRSLDDQSADAVLAEEGAVVDEVAAFGPEVIYYRPMIDQHPQLHALALRVLAQHQAPLVTHIMDDWPSRLEAHDEVRGRIVDQDLRLLLRQSDEVLSISEKMSAAFGDRYGVAFEAIANGVDPATYRAARAAAKREKSRRTEVVLRYCGALAEDMTLQTVVDVAHAVDALQGELSVRLEVYTMPAWRRRFEEAVAGLRGITISDAVFGDRFPSLLAGADILVLAYNFDQDSLRYIGLSMPNKLPEYLASGAAVLAVGPREVNGIEYVLSHSLGCCVTERDRGKLTDALRRLGTDPAYRDELATKGQAWAFEHLDLASISTRFQTILRETADRPAKRIPLLGPYSRGQKASIDETEVAARLMMPLERDGFLLDVGAHHGSSLQRFAEAGWTVVACEPDSENRARLTERFGAKSNVSIDPRAVSDEPAQEVPLFSSAQSSGISSLHVFHETHRETETVDVTTVAEVADAYDLPRIDFLKIDVEGFDWNVLKGVPWDRIKPGVIECEFEDAKTLPLGHTYRDIADDLVSRGYTVYLSEWHPIVRYGVGHDWRQLARYPTPLSSSDAWGNILAFRNDPGPKAVTAAFEACLSVENPSAVEVGSHETAPAVGARSPAGSEGEVGYDVRSVMPTDLSRYARFYLWAKTRNPAVLFLGRLVMWCGRKVQRYPALTAAYLAVVAGLVVAGFLPALTDYAPLFWVAAGALVTAGALGVVTGFAGFLIKEARHELELEQLSLRRRLERTEASLRSEGLLEAKVGELVSAQKATGDALLAAIDDLHRDQKTGHDALRAKNSELEAKNGELEAKIGELESAIDTMRQDPAGPLTFPAPGSRPWVPLTSLENGSSTTDRFKVRYAGGEGVQLVIQPTLLPVEAGGRSESVGVSSLQELDQHGVHAARWELTAPVEDDMIGILVALRPQGRRFVELNLNEAEPLVSAQFDLEEVALLGGNGANEAAAAIHGVGGGWRLCCIRLPLAGQSSPVVIRLALASSADFLLDYEGQPPSGLLTSDPVAIRE